MGAEATVEETALAVLALAPDTAAAKRGCSWLVAQGAGGLERSAPIGLYFALLWYDEQLYPLVWALEALGRNLKQEEG
jgi:squalene-hopene/tetraprenyl-beta-curcumene cyclase